MRSQLDAFFCVHLFRWCFMLRFVFLPGVYLHVIYGCVALIVVDLATKAFPTKLNSDALPGGGGGGSAAACITSSPLVFLVWLLFCCRPCWIISTRCSFSCRPRRCRRPARRYFASKGNHLLPEPVLQARPKGKQQRPLDGLVRQRRGRRRP